MVIVAVILVVVVLRCFVGVYFGVLEECFIDLGYVGESLFFRYCFGLVIMLGVEF